MESAGEINWPFVTQRLMLMQRVLQICEAKSKSQINCDWNISNFSFTLELVQVIFDIFRQLLPLQVLKSLPCWCTPCTLDNLDNLDPASMHHVARCCRGGYHLEQTTWTWMQRSKKHQFKLNICGMNCLPDTFYWESTFGLESHPLSPCSEVSCSDVWQILSDAAVADCSSFVPWTCAGAGRPRQMSAKPGLPCSWGLWLEFSNSAKFKQLRMSTSTSPFNNLTKKYKKSEHMSWHEQIPVDVHGWPNNPGKMDRFPLCHGVKRVKHWAKLLTRSYKTKTKVLDSVDHSLLSQCDLCSSGHLQYVGGSNEINWEKNISYFTHPIMFRPLAARICRFASDAYRVLQANGYYAVCSLASSRFAGVISTAWMRSLDW